MSHLDQCDVSSFMTLVTLGLEQQPQSTTVEFCVWNNMLIFDTFKDTRKYRNIQHDGRVAVTVMPNKDTSIDIEGTATELSGEDLERAKECYFKKIPAAEKWGNNEDIEYFAISISWSRLTDVSSWPWKVEIVDYEKEDHHE